MRHHLFFGIIAITLLACACTAQQEKVPASLNAPFQLKVGQEAFIESEGLGIKLLNITSDSRCPRDFRCVLPGELVAEIEISHGAEILGIYGISTWRQSPNHASKINVGKYVVELENAEPYPKDNRGIRLSDYVLTFSVSKAVENTPATGNANAAYQKNISFEAIRTGSYGYEKQKKNIVIDNNDDWAIFWEQMDNTQALPQVDFSKNIVVAVFQGESPSGGYSIRVEKIIETESALEIFVREVSPGQKCSVTFALTQPYTIAVVEKTGKEVSFTTEKQVQEC